MSSLITYRETMRRHGAKRNQRCRQRVKQARDLAERLAARLKKRFDASRVVPFGSVARKSPLGIRSDIDLAAWGLAPRAHLNAIARLQDCSPEFVVDLVRMEQCSDSLWAEIKQEGGTLNGTYLTVAGRIRRELEDLRDIATRVDEIWNVSSAEGFHVDAVALNLHGFYASLERVFEIIARQIDETEPSGSHWYQELLEQT